MTPNKFSLKCGLTWLLSNSAMPLIGFALLLFCSACSFDSADEVFLRRTQAIFVPGSQAVARITASGIDTSWAAGLKARDVHVAGNMLWALTTGGDTLVRTHAGTGEVQARIALDSAGAGGFALGARMLLVAYPTRRGCAFLDVKTGEKQLWLPLSAPAQAHPPHYRAGKFYLPLQNGKLLILHETALAPIDSCEIPGVVFSMQDSPVAIEVQTQDSTGAGIRYAIEYNANLSRGAIPMNTIRIQFFSPFRAQIQGTEFILPIVLHRNGTLLAGSDTLAVAAQAAYPDFLSGDVYVLREDSLWRYNAHERMKMPEYIPGELPHQAELSRASVYVDLVGK